jgi:hypothetical protein
MAMRSPAKAVAITDEFGRKVQLPRRPHPLTNWRTEGRREAYRAAAFRSP